MTLETSREKFLVGAKNTYLNLMFYLMLILSGAAADDQLEGKIRYHFEIDGKHDCCFLIIPTQLFTFVPYAQFLSFIFINSSQAFLYYWIV